MYLSKLNSQYSDLSTANFSSWIIKHSVAGVHSNLYRLLTLVPLFGVGCIFFYFHVVRWNTSYKDWGNTMSPTKPLLFSLSQSVFWILPQISPHLKAAVFFSENPLLLTYNSAIAAPVTVIYVVQLKLWPHTSSLNFVAFKEAFLLCLLFSSWFCVLNTQRRADASLRWMYFVERQRPNV